MRQIRVQPVGAELDFERGRFLLALIEDALKAGLLGIVQPRDKLMTAAIPSWKSMALAVKATIGLTRMSLAGWNSLKWLKPGYPRADNCRPQN